MFIVDIGRRGLGKTSLAGFQASQLNPNQIWFDPGNQVKYVDLKTGDVNEMKKRLEEWPEGESFTIAFTPGHGDIEAYWNRFAATLWPFVGDHKDAASFVLGVDEAHRLQSPQYLNDWLDEFIRRSPRRERGDDNPIDLIQTTHAPQDLHRVSWGESDYIYLFNIFDKRALKAIDEQFHDKIPDIKEIVTNLKTPKTGGRDVLEIESETAAYRVITDPNEWKSDIRKPKPPKDWMEATEREMAATYGE